MTAFLKHAGWGDARATPLAGDASTRRYTRLHRDRDTAILMEDPGGDVAEFARLSRHLCSLGLSAPQILAQDADQGLLLIEDLGDALFARLMTTDPDCEIRLYETAIDALVVLHDTPPPAHLPVADPATLARMTDLAFDWYVPRAGGQTDSAARQASTQMLEDALQTHAPATDVMILRDFHAENLLWLPDRTGAARAGLLDFQDALQGHRAYDLASLVTDARRSVSPATAQTLIHHYLTRTGQAEQPFRAALGVLSVQRNLRILGVFARLAATRGKPHYVDLIPRVWDYLMRDLDHPALGRLAPILRDALPPPNPRTLQRLRTHA